MIYLETYLVYGIPIVLVVGGGAATWANRRLMRRAHRRNQLSQSAGVTNTPLYGGDVVIAEKFFGEAAVTPKVVEQMLASLRQRTSVAKRKQAPRVGLGRSGFFSRIFGDAPDNKSD